MATFRWALTVLLVIALAVGLGVGIVALTPLPARPAIPLAARGLGWLVVVGGVALAAWTFRHHPVPLMARVTERTIEIGMKKLDPAESIVPRLITSGPYRYVRNPIYLSVLLVMLGLALAIPLTGLFLAGAILLAWWNFVVIPPEERELAARFGDEYARYRAQTMRFMPRP